jgi:glycosyltransferase involved in cell wall biosynthesis
MKKIDAPQSKLYLDVSELIHRDAKSGIQRVVKNILFELYQNKNLKYSVDTIYALKNKTGYFKTNYFQYYSVIDSINYPIISDEDSPVNFLPGDVFLGLDFQPEVIPFQKKYLQEIQRRGVRVIFVIYDILSITMPQFFPDGAKENFEKWLTTVLEVADEIICISEDVAKECTEWIKSYRIDASREIIVHSWNLGSNFSNNKQNVSSSIKNIEKLECNNRINFLSVGTIEPRKGHAQILDAFETLWEKGFEYNLIFVGKVGWNTGNLIDRFKSHQHKNAYFFWFESLSDEHLYEIYSKANCLIAASYGEGYGLPIIEAANRGIPIICRDIPVFREVAGKFAFYTKATDEKIFAEDIQIWVELFKSNHLQDTSKIELITWDESANLLSAKLNFASGVVDN